MKETLRYLIWTLGVTLWMTVCFVIPDFVDNPVGNWQTMLAVTAYITAVGIFQFFVVFLLGFNRYACTALLPLYALAGSVCAYYRLIYHVTITPLLLDAALHTHAREAAGVISIWLIVWIIINVGVAILVSVYRFRKIRMAMPAWLWVAAAAMMVGYYAAIPRLKQALVMRFPVNLVYSISECIAAANRPAVVRQYPKLVSAEVPDSLVVVAVIGEAARADHMQLNGYPRMTNPLLSQDSHTVSLPHIYSQYTNTNGSVPHLLTRADSAHTDYAYTEHSFVSLFHQTGFHTVWLSNKNQTKPFRDFMEEADTIEYTAAARAQSLYAKWLDGDMLPLMDTYLGQQPRQLFVLHTMGSHWLYDTHVSDDLFLFQPVVSNRDVRQNSQEQIINSYDNTMVYLDAFLYDIISRVRDYPAILLYLSDHGESLGEGGRYLHAQVNAEEENYPAALVWYSDKYQALFPEKVEALQKNSLYRYRTDYFFYSILSAAGMQAEGDNASLNIFIPKTEPTP